jgi:hypothetical protein
MLSELEPTGLKLEVPSAPSGKSWKPLISSSSIKQYDKAGKHHPPAQHNRGYQIMHKEPYRN